MIEDDQAYSSQGTGAQFIRSSRWPDPASGAAAALRPRAGRTPATLGHADELVEAISESGPLVDCGI
ncbi:MAG: hypothetical protein ACLT98_00375 [Eggerthellaceae bacterium]